LENKVSDIIDARCNHEVHEANYAGEACRKYFIYLLRESRKYAFVCCTYRWRFSRACSQDVLDLCRWHIRCAHHAECCPLC